MVNNPVDFTEWKWLNESRMVTANGEIAILAPANTDWFNNPVPENGVLSVPVANAPFFFTEVTGDFVFRAKVRPNHRYTYPFGYGLSYTCFDFNHLSIEKLDSRLKVSVDVQNVGPVSGDEVAQLYIRRVSPSRTVHPIRRLIGFERLHDLAPGESRLVEFTVNPGDLEIYVEAEGRKILEPGDYLIYAGGSCLDERVCAKLSL